MKKDDFDVELYVNMVLEDLDPLVNGEEKPTEPHALGYVEGTWDALVILLNNMGIEHTYEKTIQV